MPRRQTVIASAVAVLVTIVGVVALGPLGLRDKIFASSSSGPAAVSRPGQSADSTARTGSRAGKRAAPVQARSVGKKQLAHKKQLVRMKHILAERVRIERAATSMPFAFSIATFNVLGSNHTRHGADAARFAAGPTRARWAADVVRSLGADIVGMQEIQRDQLAAMAGALANYSFYPGASLGSKGVPTTLMWRNDLFRLVATDSIQIPFVNQVRPMPVVELQDIATRRTFFVINAHNAPQSRQAERNVAVAHEVAAIQKLEATGKPIFFVGDLNEKAPVFCAVTARTTLKAANGGSEGGGCRLPAGRQRIDWIFGSRKVDFTSYGQYRTPLVARTTDHAVVLAHVRIP